MADVCITNLEDALRETGLSDDAIDSIMADFEANKDTLFGKDEAAQKDAIDQMLADTQRRAEQKRALQLKVAEKVITNSSKITAYTEAGINVDYWLTDIVDGSTNTGMAGGMRGYSVKLHSRTDIIHEKFKDYLVEEGGKNADGSVNTIYLDMFNGYVKKPDEQFNKDFTAELGAWQNKVLGDAKHREFDPDYPEPGHTKNDVASKCAKALVRMQEEHNATLRTLGVDPGLIKDYFLPQQWFPDLMLPGITEKTSAFIKGITLPDGTHTREINLVNIELERRAREKFVNMMMEHSDHEVTTRNLRHYLLAMHRKEFRAIASFADNAAELAPTVARALRDVAENPPNIKGKHETDAMTALFGEEYHKVRTMAPGRRNKSTLEYVSQSSKFSEQQRLMAKELLDNPDLLAEVKNLVVPIINVDLPDFFNTMHNNITHPKTNGMFYKLGANKEQDLMQMRLVQFKDAHSYNAMQEEYGWGNAAAHAMASIKRMAEDEVQMQHFAGNPHAVLSKTVEEAENIISSMHKQAVFENTDPARIDKLQKALKQFDNGRMRKKAEAYADFIAGRYNRRSDSAIARTIYGALTWGRLSLGQSLFAAIGDIPTKIDQVHNTIGSLKKAGIEIDNPITQMVKTAGYFINIGNWKVNGKHIIDQEALVHGFVGSLKGTGNRLAPYGMSSISDARAGDWGYRLRQKMRQGFETYQALTLAQRMDECSKQNVADMVGTALGTTVAKKIKYTDSRLGAFRTYLQMADIGELEYNLIGKRGLFKYGTQKENWCISARELEKNLTDADMVEYLVAKGYDPEAIGAFDIRNAKQDLVDRYDEFVVAISDNAVVTPNLETQLVTKAAGGAIDPNSAAGAMFQLLFEFTSYPMRVMFSLHRSWFMHMQGVGAPQSNHWAVRGGLTFANMMLFGYFSFAAKSLLKGKPLPDPTDPDTIRQSAMAGGGLGYFGELVCDWYGQDSVKNIGAILGPTGTALADAVDLTFRATKGKATMQQLVDYGWQRIPNLWVAKTVLDMTVKEYIYNMFGATADSAERLRKWEDKYGTLKDSPLFDQFKKLW